MDRIVTLESRQNNSKNGRPRENPRFTVFVSDSVTLPTGALDTNTGLAVMHLFKELIEKENVTIVMTTHDTNLMELGDVVYEMEDGMIGR